MMIPEPTSGQRCPRCGTPGKLAGEEALCPGCLLVSALDCGTMEDEPCGEFPLGECGDYDLRKIIGRGGHGVVFLANRRGSSRPFALKMLASAQLAGPDELRRFRLEAESAQSLDHPNLVKVHEIGEHDGSPYYVMDYAPGGTLADRLRTACAKSALHDNTALIVKVARAIHFAHERGVLHRDIKPANILLDERQQPLVSDFGLARLLHAPSGVTMTGAALGTPSYMSPEQAAGGSVTIATDLFSLGAILFQLLTGRPPFQGDTPLETLRKASTMDAPDPRSITPWIDRDLATVCLGALRREPARRYPSVAAFADDLECWQHGEPVLARPVPLPEKCAKWCRRHPILATLTATGGLAILALAGVFIGGSVLLREERNFARQQEAIARQNAKAATLARDESQLNAYAADIYLAFRAFDDGHLGLARKMLSRHLPKPGSTDLRGFEWHALAARCRGDDTGKWQDHSASVMAVAFSPDGKTLASAGRDGQVMLRSFPGGEIRLQLPKPDAPRDIGEVPLLTSVSAKSAEMKALLMSGNLNPNELRMRGRPSKLGEISAIAWSPDGTRLATAGLGSYVRLWSVREGGLEGLIPLITVRDMAFSADGKRLFVHRHLPEDSSVNEMRVYRCEDLSLEHAVPDLQAAHAISPDGGHLAVMPRGGNLIRIHEVASMKPSAAWDAGIGLKQLEFSHDGRFLHGLEFTGSLIATWRVHDGQRTGSVFPIAGPYERFRTSPDGTRIASTGAGQTVCHQAIGGASPAAILIGHEDSIHSLVYSPDGRWLASGGNDHTCRVWNALPVEPLQPDPPDFPDRPVSLPELIATPGGKPPVWTRAPGAYWTGDGRSGGRISLHPLPAGRPAREFTGPPETYACLIPSDDGKRLAAFTWPRTLRLMDVSSGKWTAPRRITAGTAGPIVFSPDSEWTASGGDDNSITIRQCDSDEVIAVLRGHQGMILDIAVSPDGRTIASSSDDKTLRLWHVPTWRDLGVLHQGEIIHRLAFSGNGEVLRGSTADQGRRYFEGKPR